MFFKRFYLFIFRQKGRVGEREGEKHQCVVISRVPPAGDLAHNPGMCPDWESNQLPFGFQAGINPLSHTSHGKLCTLKKKRFIPVSFWVVGNGIIIFVSMCSLLVYKNTIGFHMLILYPLPLLNSLISFRSCIFLVNSVISAQMTTLSANMDSLMSYFLVCMSSSFLFLP